MTLKKKKKKMGKGGMSHGEAKDVGEEENMAAWLLGVNTLKIQPFKLPTLGIFLSSIALYPKTKIKIKKFYMMINSFLV